jgi:hypothetical protein
MDIQHSINTLDHVILMSRDLSEFVDSITVRIPIHNNQQQQQLNKTSSINNNNSSDVINSNTNNTVNIHNKLVISWTHEDVINFLSTTSKGRFAKLVVPHSMTGIDLM